MSGIQRIPIHLWWSSANSDFDFGNESTRLFIYEQILQQGMASDVVDWVQPTELLRFWDQIFVTAAVHDVWGPWAKEHLGPSFAGDRLIGG